MNLFGKISLIMWFITLVAVAIMFDWFGSRDIALSALEFSQGAVEKLSATGDQMQGVLDTVANDNESLTGARESVNEKMD